MNKFKNLTNTDMKEINGGRLKVKQDTDGDGRWDIKFVYNNDGLLIKAKYRD